MIPVRGSKACQTLKTLQVKGAANTEGGVLIALIALTTITLSVDENSVEAGPALNWYDMNSFLEPYGRIVVGGRFKTIAIAGLTIEGGISYFTANGEIVTASAINNSDLFWAMKGGGSNFGIVTKFTFATHKAPKISTAIQIFTEAFIPAYITAVSDLANCQDQVDIGAGGIFTIFSMLDTPFQVTRTVYGTYAVIADNATLFSIYNIFIAGTPEMVNIMGFSAILVFQPIPKRAATVAKTCSIGKIWSLDNTKSYIFWLIPVLWSNASEDETVTAWSAALRKKIYAENVAARTGIDLMYMNACADDQKPFTGMPAANLAKLKAICQKYDPTLVFRDLSTGGYKLD